MVVELIVTTLVTQAVGHYAQRGFVWFDSQTQALAERAASGDDDARREVSARLGDKLLVPSVADPEARGAGSVVHEGITVPREQVVADVVFNPPPRNEGPAEEWVLSPVMAKFVETLDGTFRAVHELPGSMAAMPGWFHCEHCVCVVDARARHGSWDPEARLVGGRSGRDEPCLELWDVDRGSRYTTTSTAAVGLPLVTVVACDGPDQVMAVLDRLRPALASIHHEGRHWSKLDVAEVAGVDPDRVRSVLEIHEDRVRLSGPAADLRGRDEDILAFRKRPKVGAVCVPLTSPAGVRSMKADLVRQVLATLDDRADWLDI